MRAAHNTSSERDEEAALAELLYERSKGRRIATAGGVDPAPKHSKTRRTG